MRAQPDGVPATSVAGRGITLLVNPTAGGGRAARAASAAAARLAARGVRPRRVATRDGAHVAAAAAEAFDRGDVAVAVGGDGMLRLVAAAAAGREDAVVGVVPAGRGNDFARYVGLPRAPEAAADALVDGLVVAVDTGVARGADEVERPFLSIVSVGFDAEANRIANGAPSVLGGLVYLWGVVGALAGLRPVPLRLVRDGAEERHRVLLTAVANAGAYGGGMHMAPDASVTDGLLDVVVVAHRGRRVDACDVRDRLRLLRFLPRVFDGAHVRSSRVSVTRGRTVRLEADDALEAYADGDPIGRLPMTVEARAGALRLVVPSSVARRLGRGLDPFVAVGA